MEMKVQRFAVYGGLAMVVVWVAAWLFVAGFIPPSAPVASPGVLKHLYGDHGLGIKVGMVLAMFACALLVPFAFNGLMGLYVPLTAFTIWLGCMTYMIHKNLNRQIASIADDLMSKYVAEGR